MHSSIVTVKSFFFIDKLLSENILHYLIQLSYRVSGIVGLESKLMPDSQMNQTFEAMNQ